MKKLIFIPCLAMAFLTGCRDEPATPPAVVLDSMFLSMKDGNLDNMKRYITKSDVALLDAAEQIMSKVDPEGIAKIKSRITAGLKERSQHMAIHFKNEKIDGDRATVDAEITDKTPGAEPTAKPVNQTFELVKEDNTWKIALSKPGNEIFNSMKGNMGPRKADLKDGIGKLQKMNPDSLKMLISKGLQALDSMDKQKQKQ